MSGKLRMRYNTKTGRWHHTKNNVISLVESEPLVDVGVVRILGELLEEAKAGKIIELQAITIAVDGKVSLSSAGNRNQPLKMLGAMTHSLIYYSDEIE